MGSRQLAGAAARKDVRVVWALRAIYFDLSQSA